MGIPPALNTDLGGKGLHNECPPVSDFIDAVFQQIKEGKTELTFGVSDFISGEESFQLLPGYLTIFLQVYNLI